jgi:hypothetical protein
MKIVWKEQEAIRHGREFTKHILPAIIKPARTLWNEVIGFFFFCIAAVCGLWTVRYAVAIHNGTANKDGGDPFRVILAAFCTVLTAWYCFSSFRRARRISRS